MGVFKSTFITVLLLFITSLLGCAFNAPQGQFYKDHDRVQEDESLVYFYQPKKHIFSSGCLMVSVDGEDRGCVGNPGYTVISLSPGEHAFTFRRKALIDVKSIKALPFSFEFEAGKAYYFKHKMISYNEESEDAIAKRCCSGEDIHGIFLMTEDSAEEEMAGLRLWR